MSRPWMPLYVADYLADTGHLNAAQSGAYLHLIMHYWQTGKLPVDDCALARVARMSEAEWRKAKPVIVAFFTDDWKHKRIEEELAKASDISNKRKAAAEQRHSNSNANASANAEQMHTQSLSPSHPPLKKDSSKGEGKGKTNGWSPPKHGAQSTKHKTVYILKASAEWPLYVEAMGKEPEPDGNGGFWFPICGATTIPPPSRLQQARA